MVYYPKVCEAAPYGFLHCLYTVYYPKFCEATPYDPHNANTLSIIQKSAKLHRTALTMLIHGLISKSLRSCTVRLSQCWYIVLYPKVCKATPYDPHNANTWSNIQKSAKLHHTALTMLIHSLISKSLRSCTIWLFTVLIHSLLSKSLRSCTIWPSQC